METNAQYNMNGVCNTIPLLQFALDGRERYIQYAYGFFCSLFIFNRIILSPALTSKLPWATSSRLLLPHKPLSFQQFCMCEFAHYNECVYWWQSQKDENFCFLSTSSWWHYVVINGRIPSPELKVRREMMNNKAISTFSKKQINSQREWHVCIHTLN